MIFMWKLRKKLKKIMIRISKEDKCFIKCAEDDSQLGEEAAFLITNAQVGSIFQVYSEKLMDALHYPHDDVEASLRLFYYCKKVGFGNTEQFFKGTSVNWAKFRFVRDLSVKVTPAKVRDPRCCKPCDECACIDLLRMMFAKHVISNTCIYAGGKTFLDYSQALLLHVSPTSVVHYYSKLWDSHPAVYFKLKQESDGLQYANFLCLVQPMIKTELMFSEITDSEILVGKAIAKKVIESAGAGDNTLGRFAVFCGYNNVSSKLSVKHAKHIFGELKAYIEKQMESVVKEDTRLKRRHFWLEENSTLVVIGAGLQIQDLFIGESATDSLLIDLEGQVIVKQIQQLKEFIKDAFSLVSSRVLKIGQKDHLLVVLSTVGEAQQVMHELTNGGKFVEYYRFKFCSDFWEVTSECDYIERAADEICNLCSVVPDEKKFIRLTLCGHILCDECVVHYLRSVESFPVKCTMSECRGILLFDDINVLLSHFGLTAIENMQPTFSILVKHALTHFLQTNKCGYRRCLTNNCSGILDPKSKVESKGICAAPANQRVLMDGIICCKCLKSRCGLCGLDVHIPVGCQQYFQSIYESENPGINNWKSVDPANRRFCPNNDCHAIIEKDAGCNHMQCLRCRKHFCWICEDYQSTTSREIYAHLEDAHRGNGAEGLEAWEDYLE